MADIGKGNVDKTRMIKERNAQSQKMLSIAKETHTVRTGMEFTHVLLMHKQCPSDDCQELKHLEGATG